jgi:heterodisulfide reductase subunit C
MRIDPEFRKELLHYVKGEDLFECYQCGKCSSFCPVFNKSPDHFNPRRIIEKALIGAPSLLEDISLWRCTTCYECVENCPQGVNFVDIIMGLRNMVWVRGRAPRGIEEEVAQVLKEGFIYPETGRIRRIKEEMGLSIKSSDGVEDLKKLFEGVEGGGKE